MKDWSNQHTAITGAVIAALLSLGIFATKADLSDLKAYAENQFVTKTDLFHRLDRIETDIRTLNEKLDVVIGGLKK